MSLVYNGIREYNIPYCLDKYPGVKLETNLKIRANKINKRDTKQFFVNSLKIYKNCY